MLTRSSRWKLNEMREDIIQRGVTLPTKGTVKKHCPNKEAEVLDLAALKDFVRFQASVT